MKYHLGGHYKNESPCGSLQAGTCVELLWMFSDRAQLRARGSSQVLSVPINVFRQVFKECECSVCGV